MSKTLIHVGLPKSASTFFQEKIFPNFTETVFVSRPYTQQSRAFNKLQYADESLYNVEDIRQELKQIFSESLIISDEVFCGLGMTSMNCFNPTIVAKRLNELFPDAEILLFLRGQKDILLSLYNQSVKMGFTESIDQYIWYPKQEYSYDNYINNKRSINKNTRYYKNLNNMVHVDYLLYYELIKIYEKYFNKTHVFLYEEFCTKPKQVLNRLEEILGQKLIAEDISFSNKVNSKFDNIKLKRTKLKNKMRDLLKTKNKYVLAASSLIYGLMPPGKDKLDISDEEYVEKLIEGFYLENNRKIIKEYPSIPIKEYPDKYQY